VEVVRTFPPVEDLNVGVVTSDMGTGGFSVPTCEDSADGDDGILQTDGNTSVSGCMGTYPNFLNFMPGDDVDAFANDFSCVARLGTGGCGFEQQLEAVLKAITPSDSPIVAGSDMEARDDPDKIAPFRSGNGHADGMNSGFIRPDSLLALVLVTDEDDCSAQDPEIFNPDSTDYTGELNLRCFQHPDAVFPVDRYVKGFLAQRADQEDLLIYAAITGIPTELIDSDGRVTADFDTILDHPKMQEMVDSDEPTRLEPSCNVPGRGLAFPPRRIVNVAQQLEMENANGIVQSICQDDFTPALQVIIDKIAEVLSGTCLPRDLNPNMEGLVECDVIEVLPTEGDFTECSQLRDQGRFPANCAPDERPDCAGVERRVDEDTGGEVCVVQQLPTGGSVPDGAGWYYDDFSDEVSESCGEGGQRIAFTSGNEPETGVTLRLECLQNITGGGTGACGPGGDQPACELGSPCASREDCGMFLPSGERAPGGTQGMTCVDANSTCQAPCETDADCLEQNLGGYVCPSDAEMDELGLDDRVCVNPTCSQF
ncbi:MAG: hypothetical protein ACOCUS_06755, partial [Polyangiales bacterium]